MPVLLQQNNALKLDYAYHELALLLNGSKVENESIIHSVAFDSRRITHGKHVLFFALEGVFRDGHDFIEDAYNRGVRHFVVSKSGQTDHLQDAHEIKVDNTLSALQQLAAHHRQKYDCPIVAITGSNGKTTVKEWLSHLLNKQFSIARSPKSYNSKLGVAISLLEINSKTDIALIEVGVAGPNEMVELKRIIAPTHGIFTSFGTAHREQFETVEDHLQEKLNLFNGMHHFLYPSSISEVQSSNGRIVPESAYNDYLENLHFSDQTSRQNARLAVAMAIQLGLDSDKIISGIKELNPLALRLESYDGVNGNTIINDTYNLDKESLRLSLEYQLANSQNKKRIVIVGLKGKDADKEKEITEIVSQFSPNEFHFHYADEPVEFDYKNSSILIKGTRSARMERIARRFKQQNHQTYLEIDLTAVRHNINYHKRQLKDTTRLLCMVKASSYGSDARTMGKFLESMGVDYLGVAYPDEGVELRKNGVHLPILVMNCEEIAFAQCIEYRLEPAIYSLAQLNSFITELIHKDEMHYPIHIKLETGMNRLGFVQSELGALKSLIKGQPEIYVKSIYSHLAESDQVDSTFTRRQIDRFNLFADQIDNEFPYKIMRHILNSSGIENYPESQLDMVRLGIGMYGVSQNKHLRPALSWYSTISQIKEVNSGDSVGYGRTFVASQPMSIAVIPVGYADGFRRSLGQGKGGVYINGIFCPTVGNVCMDMIMVDVSHQNFKAGDRAEIIGEHQTIGDFAELLETIPYEIMTGLSSRVHRLFVDQ